MELTCPKCHGAMRTYERNGVHVDQCSDCRGIFLDRGELDRLVDAENAWHGGTRPAERHDEDRRQESRHDEDRRRESRHDEDRRRESRHESGHESGRESQHRSEHPPRQEQYPSGGGLGAVVGEVLKQVGGQKHGGYGQQHSSHRPRKKESFLGDLFG